MQALRFALLFALVLLTAACGWQLRGSTGGGFSEVAIAIEGDVDNRLAAAVASELRNLDARLVDSSAAAQWRLRLNAAEADRRAVAADADGFASDYELRYRIDFSLLPGGRAAEDAVGVERQSVQTSAAYSADPDNLQAQQAEEEQLERELREDAVRLLLARLGRFL